VVNLLDPVLIFEWYMARGSSRAMSTPKTSFGHEIEIHSSFDSRHSTKLCDRLESEKCFMSLSSNFASLLPYPKLEMRISIHFIHD
jgi:hypothetical protein